GVRTVYRQTAMVLRMLAQDMRDWPRLRSEPAPVEAEGSARGQRRRCTDRSRTWGCRSASTAQPPSHPIL
ncbi:unnamed protein product, partial [Closterium sp. Naga37s-1]